MFSSEFASFFIYLFYSLFDLFIYHNNELIMLDACAYFLFIMVVVLFSFGLRFISMNMLGVSFILLRIGSFDLLFGFEA